MLVIDSRTGLRGAKLIQHSNWCNCPRIWASFEGQSAAFANSPE